MKQTTVPHLTDWITDLQQRGIRITITQTGPALTGPVTGTDHHHAQTYRHALTIAAQGTHPNWWNHILDRTVQTISPDDIPWTCGTCGTPDIDILDNNLICWCTDHRHYGNTTAWPTWEPA